jgi:hypothetical protein
VGDLRQRLDEALAVTPTSDSDAAAVALARVYADAIDAGEPEVLKDLGSKFLTVLDALGMTPLARTTIKRGTSGGAVAETPLERRRRERSARQHRSANMDAAAGGADT